MEEDWDDWSDLGETQAPELDEIDREMLVDSIERHSLASLLDDRIREVHPSRANIILKFFLHAFGTELLREVCRGDPANLDNLMEHTVMCLEQEVNAAVSGQSNATPSKDKGKGRLTNPSQDKAGSSRGCEAGVPEGILMDHDARVRRVRILSAVRQWSRPNVETAPVDPEEKEREALMQVVAAENLGEEVNPFGDRDAPTSNDAAVAQALQSAEYDHSVNPRPAAGLRGSLPSRVIFTEAEAFSQVYPNDLSDLPRASRGEEEVDPLATLNDVEVVPLGSRSRDVTIPSRFIRKRRRRDVARAGFKTTRELASLFSRDAVVDLYREEVLCVRCTASPSLNDIGTLCRRHFQCALCCFHESCNQRTESCVWCFRRHSPRRICVPLIRHYSQEIVRPRIEANMREQREVVDSIRDEMDQHHRSSAAGSSTDASIKFVQGPRLVPPASENDVSNEAGLRITQPHEVCDDTVRELATECFSWGMGIDGQLGQGHADGTSVPSAVDSSSFPGRLEFSFVTCGRNSSYVLDIAGNLYGMGADVPGISHAMFPTPVPFASTHRAVQVAQCLSTGLGAVLTAAGTVYVWSSARALCAREHGGGLIYLTGLETVIVESIVAGLSHLLMLTAEGQVFTYGLEVPTAQVPKPPQGGNAPASPLDDEVDPFLRARLVKDLPRIQSIGAGAGYNVALDFDGHVWTWGHNGNGALGHGANRSIVRKPESIPGLSSIARVASGQEHVVCIDRSGALYAWGNNRCGQLGLGNSRTRHKPQRLDCFAPASTVVCGPSHTAVITTSGDLLMCGENRSGQLGLGHQHAQHSLVVVPELLQYDVQRVALGGSHTIAVAVKRSPTARGLGSFVDSELLSDVMIECTQDQSSVPAHRFILARVLNDGNILADGNEDSVTLIAHGCNRRQLVALLTNIYTESDNGGTATDLDLDSVVFTRKGSEHAVVLELSTMSSLPSLSVKNGQVASGFLRQAKEVCPDLPLYSDVIFRCYTDATENDENNGASFDIHAHRIVLASRSEVFRMMFTSGMVEAQTGGPVPVIDIDDISVEAMATMLTFLYTGVVALAPETVIDVVSVAHRYDIGSLLGTCEGYLIPAVDSDNVLDLAQVATVFNMMGLQRGCMQVAQKYATKLSTQCAGELAESAGWLRGAVKEALAQKPDITTNSSSTRETRQIACANEDDDICLQDWDDDEDHDQDEYLRSEMKRIGQLVAATRKKLKLSQGDLSHKVHINIRQLQRIEEGKEYPPARLRSKLEMILKRRLK